MKALLELKIFLDSLTKEQLIEICKQDDVLLDNLEYNEDTFENFINSHTREDLVSIQYESFVLYESKDVCDSLECMKKIIA